MREELEHYWHDLSRMARAMPFRAMAAVAEELLACHRRGGTIFLLGNGGSAATASHFACDLAKGTRVEGVPAFRVIALTDNVPLLTAWANDSSYERIFAEQLQPLVRAGDLVIAISASGNSPNVLAVPEVAHRAGALVIALTGKAGGRLARLADVVVRAPHPQIELVEDAHMALAHSLCVVLRERLRAERDARCQASLTAPLAVEDAVTAEMLAYGPELDTPVAS